MKRLFRLVLVILMLVSFVPALAMAADPTPVPSKGDLVGVEGSVSISGMVGRIYTSTVPAPTKVNRTVPDSCDVVDGGKMLFTVTQQSSAGILEPLADFLGQSGKEWVFDAYSTGCNLLVEGRQDPTFDIHHIWVLRSNGVTADRYLDSEGKFHMAEGSVWSYPTGWNMENFSASKPPIAAEFVAGKARNMLDAGYSFPIHVHATDGTTYIFKPGETLNISDSDKCAFSEPLKVMVTGLYGGGSFSASIGAHGCTTVALIDGKVDSWLGARDNVKFTSISAWLMPSKWNKAQIDNWAAQNLGGK